MMNTKSNAERFLIAFTTIENEMNRRIKSDRYISYSELVRRMSRTDRNYQRFQKYLEEFGDLRNAIVHDRIDGEVIAEPHLKYVEMIEHITKLLTEPERVKDHFLRPVHIAFEEDTLAKSVEWLVTKHHSKLPVYTRGMNYVGLITTDIVTEYLVENIKQIQGKLPEITLGELLSFDKKKRNVKFIPTHTTIISVVIEFERSLASGQRLSALIITQDGASNQKPLGIISVSDLPTIYEKMSSNLLR